MALNREEFHNAVQLKKPSDMIKLALRRDGKEVELERKLASKKTDA